jgi:hypothetical protein
VGRNVSVTNRPLFGVDEQSVHFGSECHSRKMSHGRSVTVENCHSGQNMLWMYAGTITLGKHLAYPLKYENCYPSAYLCCHVVIGSETGGQNRDI